MLIQRFLNGLIFKIPEKLLGLRTVEVVDNGHTFHGSVRLVKVEYSGESALRITVEGFSFLGSPLRMLVSVCATSAWTNIEVLNGNRAGRFPQCRNYRPVPDFPHLKSQRRQFKVNPDSVTSAGIWSTDLQVKVLPPTHYDATSLSDMMSRSYAGEPPVSIDFAPIYDKKVKRNVIHDTIASWQADTRTRLSDSTASAVERGFEDKTDLLEEYSEEYDGQFYRADDFVASVVRLYLYVARRKLNHGASEAQTAIPTFALAFGSERDTTTGITFFYPVAKFLKELRNRYLLKIGWIEFLSRPDKMQIKEKEDYKGETSDEIGFSPGIHTIIVEGSGQKCSWDLDIAAGPSTAPYHCPDTPHN